MSLKFVGNAGLSVMLLRRLKMLKSPKLNYTKHEIVLNMSCHQNWNVTKANKKNEMLPKPNCHQNLNITHSEMTLYHHVTSKIEWHQNWNVTMT